MNWPEQGVYFFFEHGEHKENNTPRVVRIRGMPFLSLQVECESKKDNLSMGKLL